MRKECNTIEEAQALVDSLYAEAKYIIEAQQLASGGFAIQWQEHKSYTAIDGKVWPDEVWRTKDGRLLQIQDIEPEHCRNILRMLMRQDREAETRLNKEFDKLLHEVLAAAGNDMQDVDTINDSFVPGAKPVVH